MGYFTGDYNGKCPVCKSKTRDYETGKCVCGEVRRGSRESFKIVDYDGELKLRLGTGRMDSGEMWVVNFVQDEEGPYIQLKNKGCTLEYKIDDTQVDLEKRCTEFKCFNDFFSRGIAEGRRPNIPINGECLVKANDDGWASLISGADCRAMTFPTVDRATEFWVKEKKFDLGTFLGENVGTTKCNACKGKGCTHKDASAANCKKWRWCLTAGAHKYAL